MKTIRWLVVALVLLAVVLTLRLTVLAPDPVEVRVATVERGDVEETVSNTRAGTVKVRTRASLSPQVGGLVVELPHREGAVVRAGETLLVLDDRAQRAQLELARRTVASAAAQADEACLAAELAAIELGRTTALHGSGIASDQLRDARSSDHNRTLAACAAARATVEQARAQVEMAAVQLAFTRLEAPFAGVVAEVSTEVGEWITPSPPGLPIPPVIDLLDPESVFVSAPIDEVDAERVHVGLPVRLAVDSRGGATFDGVLRRVAPFVLDVLEQNRTVEVEADFADPEAARGVLPGTSADVEIILARREGVLRVPASAVASDGSVLVLAAGHLAERTVAVGLRSWQWAEALSGLEEGELVVVGRDRPEVKDGARAVERPR